MELNMNRQIKEYEKKRRRRRAWMKVLGVLGCLVVFCTTYALILPAITLEGANAGGAEIVTQEYTVALHSAESGAGTQYITMPQDQRCVLRLDRGADSVQWQIWSRDSWMNIYGDNGKTCELYYAKLKNVLSENTALVRATAASGGTEYISDSAWITVEMLEQPTESEAPVILDAGSPSLGDVSGAQAEPAGDNAQQTTVCPLEEHTHVPGECYTTVLICEASDAPVCGMAVGEGAHSHTEECYRELTCAQEHEHTEACYTQADHPVCGQEESAGHEHTPDCYAHVHDPATCYQTVWSCTKEEHTHNETCTMSPVSAFSASPMALGDPDAGTGDQTAIDVNTRYTVHVYYQYQGGGMVHDPWSAVFAYTGDTDAYEVTFPTVQGYKVKEVTVNSQSVEPGLVEQDGKITGLKLPATISSSLEYDVIYEPDEVKYTVTHCIQSLDDPNEYTQYGDVITKTAKTGDLLNNDALKIDGFTPVAYQYPTAAADGSTNFEIRYDRNFYKITFELNGGTGTADLYVKYGASLTEPSKPTKAGYTFDGWYTDSALTNPLRTFPTTMPAKDETYYAKWTAAKTTYTVVVWVEDLNGKDAYLTSSALDAMAGAGTKVSYDNEAVKDYLNSLLKETDNTGTYPYEILNYCTLDQTRSDKNVTVNDNGSAALNVYYTRNSYTLRFVYGRSFSSYGTTYYQMSTSNNNYSFNTGYDVASGCSWSSATTTAFMFDEDYEKLIAANDHLKHDSYDSGSYTYYYIELTAKYGENISEYWPKAECLKLGSLSLISWGTKFGSPYQTTFGQSEPNISPYYNVMDKWLIIDPKYTAASNQIAHTLVGYSSSNTKYYWTFNLYYEALSSDDLEGQVTNEFDGKTYILKQQNVTTTQMLHDAKSQSVPSEHGFETPNANSDNGKVTVWTERTYTNDGQNTNYNNNSANNRFVLNVYYTRERYDIVFHNCYWGTKTVTGVPYGKSLADYTATAVAKFEGENETLRPEYNQTDVLTKIEPLPALQADPKFDHKYSFTGKWYTAYNSATSSVIETSLFSFENATMPQSNLYLYAEWEPKEYTATFFWESPDAAGAEVGAGVLYDPVNDLHLAEEEAAKVHAPTQSFTYGQTLTKPYDSGNPDDPPAIGYGSYEFLYWTYYVFNQEYTVNDNGHIQTFDKDEPLHFPSGTKLSDDDKNEIILNLIQNGKVEERRLSFNTTLFYDDVYIYGHWNNDVYIKYVVHYVLLDDNVPNVTIASIDADGNAFDAGGNKVGVQIADDTKGSRFKGITVTFSAKTGNELYTQYQGEDEDGKACYPLVATHSLTMDINQAQMEYTFVYKRGNPVPYQVEYLAIEYVDGEDEDGNTIKVPKRDENGDLITTEVSPTQKYWENRDSIVTESYLDIPGYTLTADPNTNQKDYQITRVLTYSDEVTITEDNTIRFYYVQDEDSVNYTVEYYLQQMDGTYEKHATETENTSSVGSVVSANIRTYPGYWHDPTVKDSKITGEVTDPENGDGLVLRVYYSAYPVQVTKVWDSSVPNDKKQEVTMSVYTTNQTGNTYSAEPVQDMNGDPLKVTLNAENSWTAKVFLPYLEDGFYMIVEDTTSYQVTYSDPMTAFIDEALTEGGKVDLVKIDDGNEAPVTSADVTVTNALVTELPETGGRGTQLYIFSGLLLTAGAVMCGYTRRRKRERRN